MNVREVALRMLLDYEANGKYVNLSLASHSADNFTPDERRLLTTLLYTTVEHKLTYDYYIAYFTKDSADKLSDRTRNILRLGICQLVALSGIPPYAAVNETVKLTKNPGERSLVNGVLRSISRAEELPLPPKEKNFRRYLSVKYSIPLKTVKHFVSELGEEETERILECFNKRPRLSLTVNTTRISASALVKKLCDGGYEASRAAFSPITVHISDSQNPTKLPGFSEGEMFVQDEASAIAASVLAPKEGERIIDVCSAPGGKSFALAILSEDKALVRSYDLHESKLSLINEGISRLGLTSVTAGVRDASLVAEEDVEAFDAVLCDVPCSGLGVIAKKPDIRYKDISAAEELPELQGRILSASSAYLKRGGRLVYSTCTLNKKENLDVVLKFLSENSDFYLEDFSLGALKSSGGCLTLYPHIHNTDGFFIAKLRKK